MPCTTRFFFFYLEFRFVGVCFFNNLNYRAIHIKTKQKFEKKINQTSFALLGYSSCLFFFLHFGFAGYIF